ncbi:hypothetical protein TPHA_0G02770 [Tetrapisispora phaffii CBS 4417]|uniref:RING-type domain-containing protein n=1 Tax=Tetrapisispora phaffii (strain ATCC 24235 / CBS 4417 / NBRC 1672 / NRRL Y-8282 / UCD 70-5) TaxID=1071381 RepID=G8BW37_TETPH|nr:hypothetical protein TPHA_0G02770 [Tetrapisispora phaffii CBS 4417]CCE64115.1 hypothetical protein TPHA_0G02770 [Tetrapisispora phaffii CBS 4417]
MSNSSDILDTLTYLNRSNQYLVAGNDTWTNLINLPYRIGLSFSDATKLQYHQSIGQTTPDDDPSFYQNYSLFIDIIGYFFSSYAILCFVTAILLNRLIQMSSLTNSTILNNANNANNRVGQWRKLPLWSTFLMHLSALIPSVFIILQGLVEVDIIPINDSSYMEKIGLEPFLVRLFSLFSWSHCIETFITITSNSKPMEESDYTIFELSIQFYIMSRHYSHFSNLTPINDNTFSTESILRLHTISDCLMAMVGRIIIHVVEMFNIKHYRLLASTVVNVIFLTYLFCSMMTGDIIYFPLTTYFRHFPKIFSILIVAISVLCYLLSCLVRKDFFGNSSRDTKELQYYSFMNNWWSHLHCTGEQEFSVVINKFALLLCKDVDSINFGIQKEFPSLNVPSRIHHSFIISGYNNKLQKIASLNQVVSGSRNNNISNASIDEGFNTLDNYGKPDHKSSIKEKFSVIVALFPGFISLIWHFTKIFKHTHIEVIEHDPRPGKKLNFHDYVTNKNYASFLSAIRPSDTKTSDLNREFQDEENIGDVLLLPSEDLSEDYIPAAGANEDEESDVDYSSSDDYYMGYEGLQEHDSDNLETIDELEDYTDDADKSSVKDELVEIILSKEPINTKEGKSWMLSMWNLFQYQMRVNKRLTRSEYSKLNPENVLQDINFKNSLDSRKSSITPNTNENDNDSIEVLCVVCKTNDRNIVVWPCRCFALCEDCRISLGLRGFNTCICCRSEVHGYSKLNRT